ncbi:MAG: M20 family metallo-hydrolase [Tissierellia bacterium]|nr:M20 family metallo-hydrolase [Tissierellia bacterium]
MINLNRALKNLKHIGNIGLNESEGITRLAFSDEYYTALEMLKKYCEDKGFDTKIDKVGNLLAYYNPNHNEEFIMVGSHLDTVKSGGLYDGALGIFSALEVMESLKENGENLNYGYIMVAFNAEEGSEMGGTFGSRTMADRNELKDSSLESKISNYNLSLQDLIDSKFDFSKVVAFLELHVEQGAVLDKSKLDIGVVDGIVGITRYNLQIRGEANHAGTTPMDMRDDPIRHLPSVISKLYELTEMYKEPFVMTIGDIVISPGMFNIIPNNANIFIEVRDMEQENIDDYFSKVNSFLDNSKIIYSLEKNVEKPSVKLDANIMDIVQESAEELGYQWKVMSSGAGHDAKEVSHLIPSALIFIPSIGGISHSPYEETTDEQIEKGIKILYKTILKISGGERN